MLKTKKHEKKQVSNEEYNQAYKNKENRKIIGTVLSKYRNRIDEDTLQSCGLNGLWRCLQYHREEFSTKFTSSLWRFVDWECRRQLQILARNKFKPTELIDVPVYKIESDIIDNIDEFLDSESSKIIRLRYVYMYTLKEIGVEFGFTTETARQKLNLALEQIKNMVYISEKDRI